jgi:4-amino-4-deoxy-L-arabinose transferase-like glycosyltransferase
MAVALVLRVSWWIGYVRVIENEGVEYVRLAANLFGGNGYVSIFGGTHTLFPPLYPILIGLMTPLAGSGEAAARLVSLMAGVVLVGIAFRLAERIFGDTAAVIAGAFVTLHPLLIALSVSTYSEVLYLSFATGASLLAVECMQTPSWRRAAAVGAAIAGAYLARPEGLVLMPLFAGVLLIAAWRKGLLKPAVAQVAVLGMTTLLIGAPYMAHLSAMAGSFRWEGKAGYNNLIVERTRAGMARFEAIRGLDSRGQPAGSYMFRDQSELLRRKGSTVGGSLAAMGHAPIRRLNQIMTAVVRRTALGGWPILLLAVGGFLCTAWWRRAPERMAALLVVPVVTGAALLTLEWMLDRYLFALMPALIILAAGGAAWITRWSRLLAAALAGLVLVQSARGLHRIYDLTMTRETDRRVTGEWIREDHAEGEPGFARPLLMGHFLAPAHYGEGEMVYLPWAEEEQALQFIGRVAPDYIVLRGTDRRSTPYGAKWLDEGIGHPCAEPVTLAAEADPYRVWRWTCRGGMIP